ncbi:unnamed protein product [Rhizoctonia solani]|uniref:BTB domain-containing protein n=1 Tax=Rhizoctonia solani TaxID=456999 RepID=A0A8H3AII2_9AGAM|nr:unnamed protein product [Rhizoctonia solani]
MNNAYSDLGVLELGARSEVAFGTTKNQGFLIDAGKLGTEPLATNLKPSELLTTSRETPTLLDLNGPNINLQVNNAVIKTHEHHISKVSDTLTIIVTGDNDFLNTFTILGASIDKRGGFDAKTLVSAARILAKYNYPALRAFCMEKLEGLALNSMERLWVARALDLKPWEERAYRELSERETKITKEEALGLGIDSYWQVANARELQRRSNSQLEGSPTQTLPQTESANKQKSNESSLYIYFLLLASLYANFTFIVGRPGI